jgi:hypothetical protein
LLLREAVRLGASADPLAAAELFRRLPHDEYGAGRSLGTTVVQSLVQSGEFEAALEILEDLTLEAGGAMAAVHQTSDTDVRVRAMRAAHRRWLVNRGRPDEQLGLEEFHRLFAQHWTQLDAVEAETWLDEILDAMETDPPRSGDFRFGGRVEFHSMTDSHLFEVLNVVRALKPTERVEALLDRHADVAAAAQVYPLGLESFLAEVMAAPPPGQRGGFAGSHRDAPMMEARLAVEDGDASAIERLLEEADRLYRADRNPSDPNLAPRLFWPSCQAYRVAMYSAGKLKQLDAEALLERIPEADFALLASIELAAGAMGVPEHWGVRMEHHPQRGRGEAARGAMQ